MCEIVTSVSQECYKSVIKRFSVFVQYVVDCRLVPKAIEVSSLVSRMASAFEG
jgi:hypothetical protein